MPQRTEGKPMAQEENPVVALARHSVGAQQLTLDRDTVERASMILLDTLAVGIAGANATYADAIHRIAPTWGMGGPCRVLGRGDGFPAQTAAFLNGYQIHGQEFDCVHEGAVVHPMAAIMATSLAEVERVAAGTDNTGIAGRHFIKAICAAVDVAIAVGLSSTQGLWFFRPATAGAFGAVAMAAQLRSFTVAQTVQAFGHVYSQMCGTMQAHTEGAAVLPMQIGFNARNAVIAADLVEAGVSAPEDILEGPYGYLQLFEPDGNITPLIGALQDTRRITELSYKPFPTGRATHGGLDALQTLQQKHGFSANDVSAVTLRAPPLIPRLVNRPFHAEMAPNTARLSMQYTGAVSLLRGTVGLSDFSTNTLQDEEVADVASRISVETDDNQDPNALLPQSLTVKLGNGDELNAPVNAVYGSPDRPMDEAAHLAKVKHCCEFAGLPNDKTDALIENGLQLDRRLDIGRWLMDAWRSDIR
jgi:2-methylcitrate dehydratase PrpD